MRYLLLPISILYGIVTYIRNRLYDFNVFHSQRGDLPTIVIGNLSMGGSGKTPMSEYVMEYLNEIGIHAGFLSRGYGRKSKGFIHYQNGLTAETFGDEPLQIATKFNQNTIAVCEDRVEGIKKLKNLNRDLDLVILDDAYQHRKLKPDHTILLFDYTQFSYPLFPFPTGNLRDFLCEKKRANTVIITKCPPNFSEPEKSKIVAKIKPHHSQKVYFSAIDYEELKRFEGLNNLDAPLHEFRCLLFCGIANPKPLIAFCESRFQSVKSILFGDHHAFNNNDIDNLLDVFQSLGKTKTIALCTQKDYIRLISHPRFQELQELPFYYIEIKMKILENEAEFKNELQTFALRYKRKSQ